MRGDCFCHAGINRDDVDQLDNRDDVDQSNEAQYLADSLLWGGQGHVDTAFACPFEYRISTRILQQSMVSRRARSMTMDGRQAAPAAIRCDATAGASASSSSPYKATTA
jgi:hypothetical protein